MQTSPQARPGPRCTPLAMAAAALAGATGDAGGDTEGGCCRCCFCGGGGCEASRRVPGHLLEELRADLCGAVEGALGREAAALSQRVCEELRRGFQARSIGGAGSGGAHPQQQPQHHQWQGTSGSGGGEHGEPGRASPAGSQGSSPTRARAAERSHTLNGKVRGELWRLFVEGEECDGSSPAATKPTLKHTLSRAGSQASLTMPQTPSRRRWPNALWEPGVSPCKASQQQKSPAASRFNTVEIDSTQQGRDTPSAEAASPETPEMQTRFGLSIVVPTAPVEDRAEASSPMAAWPSSPMASKASKEHVSRGGSLARWKKGPGGGMKRPQTRFLGVSAAVPEMASSHATCKSRLEGYVKHPGFDWFFCLLIVLNSLTFGAQTDYLARLQPAEVPLVFQILEALFCGAFTIELGLRVAVHGCAFFRGKGCLWNAFDVAMVIVQQIEVALASMSPGSTEVLPANLPVVRMMRILRLVRVARLVRFLRLVRELRLLVSSILSSMKSLGWTILLLLVMIYCVSLILTQLVSDHRTDSGDTIEAEDMLYYYGSLGRSMLSLFQAVTGGVDWDACVAPLIAEISPFLAVLFSVYIAFCTLAMMNVVTGIFVENVLISARADKDHYLVSNARDIFKTLDGGVNGEMTMEDFLDKADTPEMIEFFKGIDVDPSEAASLFSLIDLDGSGSIDAEEFLRACIRLRGPAMALDTAGLVQQVRQLSASVQEQRELVEQALTTKPSPRMPER